MTNSLLTQSDSGKTHFCKIISVNQMIEEMLDCYREQNNNECRYHPQKMKRIHNQLSIDYHRMKIHYNSVNLRTMESYLFMLRKLRNVSHNIMPSLYHVTILFSIQAPFFYHYSTLNKSLPDIDDVFLVQDGDAANVEVIHRTISDQQHVDIILRKSFKRINIRTNDIHDRYEVTMIINLSKDFSNAIIMWNKKN